MTNEKKFRVEADLLGELQVPADALYGVQTQRGINNYHISRKTMSDYPDFIIANAYVKLAAAQTNHSLGVINDGRRRHIRKHERQRGYRQPRTRNYGSRKGRIPVLLA